MSFSPPFHLQRAAMVEVVRQLIQCDVPKNLNEMTFRRWVVTETKVVKGKIQQLKLPTMFREALTSMVNPIFRHMWRANDYFRKQTPSTSISSIQKCIMMCPWGTVDSKRSAEALLFLSPQELPRLVRHCLALLFCLEDHVASTYEDLDEKDKLLIPNGLHFHLGSSTQSLLATHFRSRRGQRSDFVYAVLDANEVAARHFWSATETLPSGIERTIFDGFSLRKLRPTATFLFLLSRYPTDVSLRTALLQVVQFSTSLLEWPYLDIHLHLLQLMTDENQRLNYLPWLIGAVFSELHFTLFDRGDILDNLRQFVKTFLLACNADQSARWFRFAFLRIRIILGSYLGDNQMFIDFAQLILEFLDERKKIEICESIDAPIIVELFRTRHLHRLEWLFRVCVTNERSKIIKEKMLMDRRLRWRLFEQTPFEASDELANEFVNFCYSSQDGSDDSGERTLNIERHLRDFQSDRELFEVDRNPHGNVAI